MWPQAAEGAALGRAARPHARAAGHAVGLRGHGRDPSSPFRDIRGLLRGRTVVCISHRFSTVRDADRIYVLDGGRIVEAGTHDQLMAESGMYERMFTLKAEPYRQAMPAVAVAAMPSIS